MNNGKAKMLRNNSFGKGMAKKEGKYKINKNTETIICSGKRALYKLLKKQYKRNRMNHL